MPGEAKSTFLSCSNIRFNIPVQFELIKTQSSQQHHNKAETWNLVISKLTLNTTRFASLNGFEMKGVSLWCFRHSPLEAILSHKEVGDSPPITGIEMGGGIQFLEGRWGAFQKVKQRNAAQPARVTHKLPVHVTLEYQLADSRRQAPAITSSFCNCSSSNHRSLSASDTQNPKQCVQHYSVLCSVPTPLPTSEALLPHATSEHPYHPNTLHTMTLSPKGRNGIKVH